MNKFLVVLVLALVACEADLDALIFQQFKNSSKNTKKNMNPSMNF